MADDLSSFIESQKRKLEQERAEMSRAQQTEVPETKASSNLVLYKLYSLAYNQFRFVFGLILCPNVIFILFRFYEYKHEAKENKSAIQAMTIWVSTKRRPKT